MARRVAILVRERQEEGLRVALGLTLAGPEVEVYLLDRPLADSPASRESLAALLEIGMPVATNHPGGELPRVATREIARRMVACDRVIVY